MIHCRTSTLFLAVFLLAAGAAAEVERIEVTHRAVLAGGKSYGDTGPYEVQNPRIVGLGLAAVRDAISFFHFDGADRFGTPHPLAALDPESGWQSSVRYAHIYGVSQSGRFITHTVWQGFHVDESGRMVFEGAFIVVAGGGKGGFNHRFAQTTHHPSHLEGNYMPADHPPFNFLPDGSAPSNDVLVTAKKLGMVPKIVILNNALEYWTRSASLVHTNITATADAVFHPNVRYYMVNGAPHGGAGSRARTVTEHSRNPLYTSAAQRAILVNLDRWVSAGEKPPDGRYPRIADGELIAAAEHRRRFPSIPDARHPGRNLQPPVVDYGEDFWTRGLMTTIPPKMGSAYPTLVPATDKDGNGVGGIRLPEIQAPLGTYQGWNPRRAEFGAPEYLTRFDGSFWAFPVTRNERKKSGDTRRSVAERYPSKANYVARYEAAAKQLVTDRLLLLEDADASIGLVRRMAWPPEPVDGYPFWKLEPDQ